MIAQVSVSGSELWHVAGWTMLHFLWLGALVAIALFIGRLLLRRAAPVVRYVAALGALVVLAASPLGIAAWLVQNPPPSQAMSLPQNPPPLQGVAGGGFVGPADQVANTDVSDQPIIELSAPASSEREPLAEDRVAVNLPRNSEPSFNPSLSARGISLAALKPCVPYLPWLWLIGTPSTFTLLAAGIVGTKRLRRASRPIDEGPIAQLLARVAASLRVGRRVTVAVCDRIAAPVLVGILRPIILLPPAAITGWSPDEIEMVLLHELAHVRRWDNLVNLLQRCIESLLFFHPAVWFISTWVRREREACCDAVVVGRTNRPHAYAELLVALAAQLSDFSEPGRPRPRLFPLRGRGRPGSLPASSAMAAGRLRNRIRCILQLEDDPMLVSGKSLALVLASLLITATLAVLYLPTIGQAEESATEGTESTEKKPEKSEPNAPDDWPADIVFPSPKEGNISIALYRLLGLKVVPATKEEQVGELGHVLKVVGGIDVPPEADGPVLLWNLGDAEIKNYNDVAKALETLADYPKIDVKFFTSNRTPAGTHGIMFNRWLANKQKASKETAASKSSSKFPSLEDQKLADLAWKRFGMELELIGDDDLKRVQALGYDGGVKVAQVAGTADGQFQPGDVLVGLHVWPTTNLKQIAEVLNREDLAELNPLKFYVIGKEMIGGTPENPDFRDVVRTGRISVGLEAVPRGGYGEMGMGGRGGYGYGEGVGRRMGYGGGYGMAVGREAMPGRGVSPDRSVLHYDGKTFDEWRDAWRTELSTEKRLEAVKALAAFGANGYGKEAAEAILEVAGQYDWTIVGGNKATESLELAFFDAFGGRVNTLANGLPVEDALAALLSHVDSDSKSTKQFVATALRHYARQDDRAMEAVVKLSKDNDEAVRKVSWSALIKAFTPESKTALDRVREALASGDPFLQQSAAGALIEHALSSRETQQDRPKLHYLPELFPLLFSKQESVRRHARRALNLVQPGDAPQVVQVLLEVLSDANRRTDRVEGIRALSVLGPRAKPAVDELRKFLATDDESLRIAAANALHAIMHQLEYNKLLGEALGDSLKIRVSDSGIITLPRYPDSQVYQDFESALETERKSLFP